jgi:hypothetical protein
VLAWCSQVVRGGLQGSNGRINTIDSFDQRCKGYATDGGKTPVAQSRGSFRASRDLGPVEARRPALKEAEDGVEKLHLALVLLHHRVERVVELGIVRHCKAGARELGKRVGEKVVKSGIARHLATHRNRAPSAPSKHKYLPLQALPRVQHAHAHSGQASPTFF